MSFLCCRAPSCLHSLEQFLLNHNMLHHQYTSQLLLCIDRLRDCLLLVFAFYITLVALEHQHKFLVLYQRELCLKWLLLLEQLLQPQWLHQLLISL